MASERITRDQAVAPFFVGVDVSLLPPEEFPGYQEMRDLVDALLKESANLTVAAEPEQRRLRLEVENLAGHALPSGATAERQMWIEAFVEDAEGTRTSARVSACERFDQATMMVSRSHRPAIIEPLRTRLGIGQLLPSGSVGVKVARLVDRSADLYVHAGPGLKLWDTCAPEAILVAAGGRVSDLAGAPLRYDEGRLPVNGGFVASNGVLHAGLLSAVSWAVSWAEAQAARQG